MQLWKNRTIKYRNFVYEIPSPFEIDWQKTKYESLTWFLAFYSLYWLNGYASFFGDCKEYLKSWLLFYGKTIRKNCKDAPRKIPFFDDHATAMRLETLILLYCGMSSEKMNFPSLFSQMELGECACTVTGVTGETGIDAAEMLKGLVEKLRPCCVIAVDALASSKVTRLMNTVQISDTGINPGSGVNNSRGEISRNTLGVPVIAIGVPTVVDASTLCAHFLDEKLTDRQLYRNIKKELKKNRRTFL